MLIIDSRVPKHRFGNTEGLFLSLKHNGYGRPGVGVRISSLRGVLEVIPMPRMYEKAL